MARKKSEFDWLKEKLKSISDLGGKVNDGDSANDYSYHTALKLITVRYVSDTFTKIARNANRWQEGYDGAVYVDLFAGTGLVKVGDDGDVVAGSAPCAVTSGKGFDYSVMVEKNGSRLRLLEKRMSEIFQQEEFVGISGEFDVIEGDCNEVIWDVIDKIKKRFKKPIILVFVDPEGLEIKFRTLKALSDQFQSCDFLINVNAQGLSRVAGQKRRGIQNREQTLEEYLEEDANTFLQELAEGKTPQTKYAEQVRKILGRLVGSSIKIRSDGDKVEYYLLWRTRMTGGGSGYARAVSVLKEKIERLDGNRVRLMLDQMHGRNTSMDSFF